MTVVTEEEAKGKWCPHAMVKGTNRNVFTGDVRDAGMVCVGANCMAWRWVKGNPVAGTGRGYCGVAGRP
jgi:hypothetical protein